MKTSGGGDIVCDKEGGGNGRGGGERGGGDWDDGDDGGDDKTEVVYIKRHLGVKIWEKLVKPQQVETLKNAILRQAVQFDGSRSGVHWTIESNS